jgi:hypothetical protein
LCHAPSLAEKFPDAKLGGFQKFTGTAILQIGRLWLAQAEKLVGVGGIQLDDIRAG